MDVSVAQLQFFMKRQALSARLALTALISSSLQAKNMSNISNHSPNCVLVTGASRGIGRACCDNLAQRNIKTISLSRTPPSQMPGTETHYSVDLADLDASLAIMQEILRHHPLDAIVCNVGRGDIGSLENFSANQIRQSLIFNLINPLCLVRECLPHLRKQMRSNIVFTGSISGLQGARYGTLYSAAKFGLRGAAQALLHELAGSNCHVGIVNPGSVRTGFFDTLNFEPGPMPAHALLSEDVASAISQLLCSPDHAVVSELTVQPRQHVIKKKKN